MRSSSGRWLCSTSSASRRSPVCSSSSVARSSTLSRTRSFSAWSSSESEFARICSRTTLSASWSRLCRDTAPEIRNTAMPVSRAISQICSLFEVFSAVFIWFPSFAYVGRFQPCSKAWTETPVFIPFPGIFSPVRPDMSGCTALSAPPPPSPPSPVPGTGRTPWGRCRSWRRSGPPGPAGSA